MAQPDLGACLRTFCSDFRTFAVSLEKSCRHLRRAVLDKGPSYVEETHFTSLLGDLSSQVDTVEAEVSSLERSTVDTISVAELLGHCNELYLQNEAGIQQLEEHLQQYGYTPIDVQASGSATHYTGALVKPSPSTVSTPSWGSHRKVSEQHEASNDARASSNLSTPATRDEEDCATPKQAEESTLELRRNILGRQAAKPVLPPDPGSPELLSLADLGLSASSLEALKDEGETHEPDCSTLPKDATSNGRTIPQHSTKPIAEGSSTSFQKPLAAASAEGSRRPSARSVQIPDASRRSTEEDKQQSVPGISTRHRERRLPPPSGGGDSLFPLAEPVTQEEFDTVPLFLRAQVSLQDLNTAVQKINDSMTDKRFSEQGNGADCITQQDLAALTLGPRLKAYLLLLVRLDRIVPKHVAGATVYSLQAGPGKH